MSNILPIRDFQLTQNVNAKIDMDVAFKKDIIFLTFSANGHPMF